MRFVRPPIPLPTAMDSGREWIGVRGWNYGKAQLSNGYNCRLFSIDPLIPTFSLGEKGLGFPFKKLGIYEATPLFANPRIPLGCIRATVWSI